MSNQDLSIREAGLEDIPQIVEMWVEFLKQHDKIVLGANKRLAPYVLRKKSAAKNYGEFLQERMGSGGVVFIAELGGKTAGYSLVFAKDEIPIFEIETYGYISDLYVKEEFRGKGVSSSLKEAAVAWCKKKGLKHISIALYPDNKFAHDLYNKWGFFDYKTEVRKEI